ncbi:putative capsular associated protein [Aspergillus foveolatus]|uniref:putative capsular associated protein n=1 Tax=Aspergillus foveolatus TaxID=210207 RepID=UPI003CCCE4FD
MIRLSVENGLRALLGFVHQIPTVSTTPVKYSTIPLTELDQSTAEVLSPTGVDDVAKDERTLKWWLKIGVLSGVSCARIALFRYITDNIECAPTGYSYLIPFLVAIYDLWRNQRATRNWTRPDDAEDDLLCIPITFASRLRFIILQSRLRCIIPAALLALSGFIVTTFQDARHSTYICPIVSGKHLRLQTLRILAFVLDCLILTGGAELSGEGVRRDGRKLQTLLSWGYGLLGVVLSLAGWVIYLTATAEAGTFVTSHYLRSAWGQAVLITILTVSASQLLPYYGMAGLCVLAGFIASYFNLMSTLFEGQEPFPLIPASHAFAALFLLCLGGLLFLLSRIASEEEPQFLHRLNLILRLTIAVMFGTGLIWVLGQSRLGHTHPIDLLIHEAAKSHDIWLKSAKESSNLAEAVQQYRIRYNQHPPPSSVTIDEFDGIYANLLPFRALAPHEIRTMTQKLATNPENDIGALRIRNGTVRIQEGIKPTHAWMVQSAGKMIENFSEHLPDMDLAFNLDDEPRVIAPWEKVAELQNRAKAQQLPADDDISDEWSPERDATWGPIEPADQTPETMFIDRSFQKIFDPYVAPACPPGSKARTQRVWNRHDLCIGCIRPHSMGQFPTDWSVTSDICHQPDLAHMHGLFLSPATFRITQKLVPVFSQSSTSVFNDIIFPSPWNYVDKIKYEPSDEHPDSRYTEKENTLFWIGSTTEGVSHEGRWKGMPRQRLAHLVNNNTYNHVSIFLPTDEPKSYSYQIFDGLAPTQVLGLNASVSITDPIVRCRNEDCTDQKDELGPGGRVDFQDHWQYRYLFDSDGAGFSGRFLPFLQSRSLPFKTGLFRQWFDSRVTPWLHYAPIDVRLHGLWSTLAYFAGVDANVDGRKIEMKRHDVQGRWIAEEGRKWAEMALRKEDMEIYFFRLLLEWGRLTDDRRDMLGFKLPS